MKFILKEAIDINDIWTAIGTYIKENHGKRPSYIIIHPETRHKLIVGDMAEDTGLRYRIITQPLQSNESGLKPTEKIFDLWIITSYEVEPDFMIICG
jgi:hypothetical protein